MIKSTVTRYNQEPHIPKDMFPILVEGHHGMIVFMDKPKCGMVIYPGDWPMHRMGEYCDTFKFNQGHICKHSIMISNELLDEQVKMNAAKHLFGAQLSKTHGCLVENEYGTVAFADPVSGIALILQSEQKQYHEHIITSSWNNKNCKPFNGEIILANEGVIDGIVVSEVNYEQ